MFASQIIVVKLRISVIASWRIFSLFAHPYSSFSSPSPLSLSQLSVPFFSYILSFFSVFLSFLSNPPFFTFISFFSCCICFHISLSFRVSLSCLIYLFLSPVTSHSLSISPFKNFWYDITYNTYTIVHDYNIWYTFLYDFVYKYLRRRIGIYYSIL